MKACKQISTVVQFIIFFVSLAGILMQCGIFEGRLDFSVLNYFTIMSNVGCCLYSLAGAVHALKRDARIERQVEMPFVVIEDEIRRHVRRRIGPAFGVKVARFG